MPQMAPMWWTLIMLSTTSMLLLMMMMNYFTSIKKINLSMNNPLTKFKWKWY
uniref:ATP synthase F0 subunit 8 n=1 Tax=Nesophrosyne sp. 17 GMB-2012 TaxID=1223917 RepID=UPI0021822D73|nr:ATP synthase F0 subunit 8 [Nesophrosyne sp. 17 GMB-2012]UVI59760.1 ATP synthase F0 subunit 8 [Nesophrosyne sp. 17 GMB-2012]